jgi:hypothetical protein
MNLVVHTRGCLNSALPVPSARGCDVAIRTLSGKTYRLTTEPPSLKGWALSYLLPGEAGGIGIVGGGSGDGSGRGSGPGFGGGSGTGSGNGAGGCGIGVMNDLLVPDRHRLL